MASQRLVKKLKKYCNSDMYPMHMPGHKRRVPRAIKEAMSDIYSFDVTEVEYTDSLHDAHGIIKDSQDYAAHMYGADKTYFLVNGSTCGILAAISSVVEARDTIICAAKSHISAYHALKLIGARTIFCDTYNIKPYQIPSAVSSSDIEQLLESEDISFKSGITSKVKAVYITSPTYEGVIADVATIAATVHRYGGVLIVDEAHGAHLKFTADGYAHAFMGNKSMSALDLGADIVIQSLHKTLPALTQTALLHVKSDIVDMSKVDYNLSVFETSSPSYVLMASIDACIKFMAGETYDNSELKSSLEYDRSLETETAYMSRYIKNLSDFRKECKQLNHLEIWEPGLDAYAYDYGKIVIAIKPKNINKDSSEMTGVGLASILRNIYHIETEMAQKSYVLAMTSLCDEAEGFDRLKVALFDIDRIWNKYLDKLTGLDKPELSAKLRVLSGKLTATYIYVYPPGVPIAKPGDIIDGDKFKQISEYIAAGCNVIGL